MNIVLAVCTYRRPQELKKLLLALCDLHGEHDLRVVIADNDSAAEGVAVCQALAPDYPFEVSCFEVDSSGISAVRNTLTRKALDLAPEFIVFLDDDEWPEPQWLSELLRVQAQFDADLVGGPTRPVFPESADPALLDNPYYGADLNLPDGSACQLQAGGNFLARASVIERYSPSFFDEAFSHSGSEDLAFFARLGQDGHRMRWAANAIVREPVPESRLAKGWLRQRVINIHNSRVRAMQLLQPSTLASIVRVGKTLGLASVVAILSAASVVLPNYRTPARLLRWKLIGKLSAHLGRATVRGETY